MTKQTETKVHMQRVRPGVFGGTVNGTLCNRMRVLADGMNLTDNRAEVTCSFCLRMLAAQDKPTLERLSYASAGAVRRRP
jgi:hypothetical protein